MPCKKILDTYYPDTGMFPVFSNLLSILPRNSYENWLYNNYIQITYMKPELGHGRCANYKNYIACPLISTQIISKKLLNDVFEDIIDYIVYAVDNLGYPYLLVNEAYLSCNDRRGNVPNYFLHDIFIYGYDKEAEEIYVADNFTKGKYTYSTCTFDEFRNAYKTVNPSDDFIVGINPDEGFHETVRILTPLKDRAYSYDIDLLKVSVKDYLAGTYAGIDMQEEKSDHYWGISIYAAIDIYLRQLHNHEVSYDARTFFLLYEHKILMTKRIKYLQDSLHYDLPESYSIASEIEQLAKLTLNLSLKYSVNEGKLLLSKISDNYKRIAEMDNNNLQKVLSSICVKTDT